MPKHRIFTQCYRDMKSACDLLFIKLITINNDNDMTYELCSLFIRAIVIPNSNYSNGARKEHSACYLAVYTWGGGHGVTFLNKLSKRK